MNFQAVCDAECKFLFMSVKYPGSMHDSAAFENSVFSKEWAVCAGGKWWIACDDAYETKIFFWPWSGSRIDTLKDSFNFYFFGRNRNFIERTFGQLCKKWKILKRKLTSNFHRVPYIILSCAILHNYCKNCRSAA